MTGEIVPDLKRVAGAMIFAANRPVSVDEMCRCLRATAESGDSSCAAFAGARKSDVEAAVKTLSDELDALGAGFVIREVAGGYLVQSDAACGPWLRHLLEVGRPSRLSMPALETLSIVAYRQPITRANIESIRGVSVDHVMRTLMEMQLVRITGRSELPGRPFQYGTTHKFLEHFGLRSLDDLHGAEPLLAARMLSLQSQATAESEAEGDADSDPTDPADRSDPAGPDGPGDETVDADASDDEEFEDEDDDDECDDDKDDD